MEDLIILIFAFQCVYYFIFLTVKILDSGNFHWIINEINSLKKLIEGNQNKLQLKVDDDLSKLTSFKVTSTGRHIEPIYVFIGEDKVDGTPNPNTGLTSVKGEIFVFDSKAEAIEFIEFIKLTAEHIIDLNADIITFGHKISMRIYRLGLTNLGFEAELTCAFRAHKNQYGLWVW